MFKKKLKKVQRLYNKHFVEVKELPLEFVGANWHDPKIRKIAILVGFNPWKRKVLSAYLKEYKTAYLMGPPTFNKLERLEATYFQKVNIDAVDIFIWGKKDSFWLKRYIDVLKYIKSVKVNVIYVEDGFLRSINSGILHSRPASLVFDSKANHFENKQSQLESLLNTYQVTNEQKKIASLFIQMFIELRLTKYYNPKPYQSHQYSEPLGLQNHVLVIGQVEDDASIVYGDTKVDTNYKLVRLAIKENPKAKILFRPHPDYYAGIRNKTNNDRVDAICEVISPEVSLFQVLGLVSKVYTISSLAGFEALLHGKEVVTLGSPFYSGWGLTDDRVNISTRVRKLSLEQLFYISYIVYPKYLYPTSDETSSFLEIVSYFLIESFKNEYYFTLEDNILFQKSKKYIELLDLPYQVLSYIVSTRDFSQCDADVLFNSIINENYDLKYYGQISLILINSSNYDELVAYTNLCLEELERNYTNIASHMYCLLSFFEALKLAQKNLNGRTINDVPDLVERFSIRVTQTRGFSKLFKDYVLVLSNNLQYDLLKKSLEWLYTQKNDETIYLKKHKDIESVLNDNKANISYRDYANYTNVLMQKPVRSERQSDVRNSLIINSANKYLELINKRYKSVPDSILNQMIYFSLLKQETKVKENFDKLAVYFGKNELGNIDFDNHFISKRLNDVLGMGSFLYKNYYYKEAQMVCDSLLNDMDILKKNYISYAILRLSLYRRQTKYEEFFSFYKKLPSSVKSSEKVQQMLAKFYRELGMFEKSKNILEDMLLSSRTLARRMALETEIEKLEFCQKTSTIINSVPQPKFPKGVVFLASQTCFNTLAMLAPVIVELKKQGFAFVNLTAGMTLEQPVGISYIDSLQGVIPLDLTAPDIKYDWIIDWEKQRVEAQNINFYQGFYERLSTSSRRFFVNINRDQVINREFYNNLRRADTCLSAVNLVMDKVVSKELPAIILSGNSHVTPFSIFRDFCMSTNHPLLSFINCNVAYEAYFSNLGSKFANTMCVTDMTLYPTIRAPFMARQEQFDKWFENNQGNPEYIEKANTLLSLNRVGSITNDKELNIIKFLEEQKQSGKKIICAFGKVPVDLNVPYDGGPAHKDMSDWITHTVEICSQLPEDIILLVKPHPHELRPEIALDLVESFEDLIKCEVGENVKILGHKDINGQALAPHLDLALLYNGSSGVEMTAQGIPVMMSSYFGNYDYPIDLLYPKDRIDYESFITSLNYPSPNAELRKRAAFLLCYLGTDEISILNQYSKRQLTNDKVGLPKWRMDKIEQFLKHGDPKMELAANRITEKARMAIGNR